VGLKAGLASPAAIYGPPATNVAGGLFVRSVGFQMGGFAAGAGSSFSRSGFSDRRLRAVAGACWRATKWRRWAALLSRWGGLELTVAVSWAICIDIGGEFSGSVSSVMNTWGNLGGAISAVAVGYLATHFGWTLPFSAGQCPLSAIGLAGGAASTLAGRRSRSRAHGCVGGYRSEDQSRQNAWLAETALTCVLWEQSI